MHTAIFDKNSSNLISLPLKKIKLVRKKFPKMSSSESILLNNPDESILDSDDIDDEVVVVPRGKGKIYQPLCDFDDFERVKQSIKNGEIQANKWKHRSIKPTELGFKHWYECKHKFAGCQTTMYALVENGSTGQQKKKTGQWYSK